MKATLLIPQNVLVDVTDKTKGRILQPVGFVLEHPDAYKLVQHGSAIPADDECRERCGMTDEEMAYAQKSYRRVSAGIHPDDYAAFDAGLMTGYDPDGKPIPGPNAEEEEDDLEFDENETDDVDDDDAATTE